MHPQRAQSHAGEVAVGRWRVCYCPPAGGSLPGELVLTGQALVFTGLVRPEWLAGRIVGPIDECAVAYCLDLDPGQAEYDGAALRLVLTRTAIEAAVHGRDGLRPCLRLSLRNNGSIHSFSGGRLPARRLAETLSPERP